MTEITVRCDKCDALVELIRQEDRTLALRCDCPEQRSIKMARKTPEGWE
ncbi:hypothetical protein HATV-3_gp63 [Haloarcula tailed virus 3]|uniref:Uncharacterized protein n=1 Tax=Haloarcula tailed virus 3 TaxID=2877990 RepID=A0AAE8Y1W9_9CAUD|nr:hypothetical protein M1M35_gp63 [Haloarcula tailed virus 3]UBF23413.1 hypothetical protein HATV-3_gp63 [Haloarcula tailed virus 3]